MPASEIQPMQPLSPLLKRGSVMSADQKPGVSRRIERIVKGQETTDGGGFKLTRVFAGELAKRMDPF